MTTETRALELLGQGLPQHIVAGALGVTEGRITQLLSDEAFAAAVSERRVAQLQQSTETDNKIAKLESDVLVKLEKQLPAMYQPGLLLKAFQILNSAKRRGASAADQATLNPGGQVVSVTLPNAIINQFTKNVNNQIIEVKDGQGQVKSLVTATSNAVTVLAESRRNERTSSKNEQPNQSSITQEGQRDSSKIVKSLADIATSRAITANDL